MERYCLLIAFTSFLERTKGSDITFQARLLLSILHSSALHLHVRLTAFLLHNCHGSSSSSSCKCTYTNLVRVSPVNQHAATHLQERLSHGLHDVDASQFSTCSCPSLLVCFHCRVLLQSMSSLFPQIRSTLARHVKAKKADNPYPAGEVVSSQFASRTLCVAAGMDVSSARCGSGQGGHPPEPCRSPGARAPHGLAPAAGAPGPPGLSRGLHFVHHC